MSINLSQAKYFIDVSIAMLRFIIYDIAREEEIY